MSCKRATCCCAWSLLCSEIGYEVFPKLALALFWPVASVLVASAFACACPYTKWSGRINSTEQAKRLFLSPTSNIQASLKTFRCRTCSLRPSFAFHLEPASRYLATQSHQRPPCMSASWHNSLNIHSALAGPAKTNFIVTHFLQIMILAAMLCLAIGTFVVYTRFFAPQRHFR